MFQKKLLKDCKRQASETRIGAGVKPSRCGATLRPKHRLPSLINGQQENLFLIKRFSFHQMRMNFKYISVFREIFFVI